MLGSERHAKTINDHYQAYYDGDSTDLPEGWKQIGAGCSRTAYLGPDGLIYKVARGQWQQIDEWETYVKIRAKIRFLPDGVSIPRMGQHEVDGRFVNVMEYIENQDDALDYNGRTHYYRKANDVFVSWAAERPAKRKWIYDVLNDFHPNNLAVKDNTVYVIDIA